MKKLGILCLYFLHFGAMGFTQQIKELPPKFFTMNQARVSVGIGVDFMALPVEAGRSDYDVWYDSLTTQWGYGVNLAFDIFAPNSFLGFYSQIGFVRENFTVYDTIGPKLDAIKSNSIRTNFSLKLRSGPDTQTFHVVFFPGYSIRIPFSDKSQLSSDDPFSAIIHELSIGVGFENLWGQFSLTEKPPRSMWMLTYYHPLRSQFNPSYIDNTWGGKYRGGNLPKLGYLTIGFNLLF